MQTNSSLEYLTVKYCKTCLGLGKLKMGTGICERIMNLNKLIHAVDIVRFVKSRRLEWLGHVQMIPEQLKESQTENQWGGE